MHALSLITHAPSLAALELTHIGSPLADAQTYAADAQVTPDAPLCATLYQNTLVAVLLSRPCCPTLAHLSLTCGFLLQVPRSATSS